jgi:hypothetical protein
VIFIPVEQVVLLVPVAKEKLVYLFAYENISINIVANDSQ